MKKLTIDIECFSSADLNKCGVYKYAESPDFEILLFACSVDAGPVNVYDLANGEQIPDGIISSLLDESIIKHAYNCAFERICLSVWLRKEGHLGEGEFLSPVGWNCDMVWAATLGLPFGLDKVGAVLKLQQQKMREGKDLIKYFCMPCKPTKTNGRRTRNRSTDDPRKWETFKLYNKRDVETETEIQKRLQKYPVPESLWEEFYIDQQINDRGVLIDDTLVQNAIRIDEKVKDELSIRMRSITCLENPNSVVQLKSWLEKNGLSMESLGRKEVLAVQDTAPEEIREVLELRLQLSKSSVKKYQAMINYRCKDGRARGTFQFYGASRTGRWSGRGIMLQNLPQNHIADLAEARGLVRDGNTEALEMLYDSIPDTLSQLIRTALIPEKGQKFIVCDFSAIEARVLSWLAGEKWRMETFASGGDIYCATASRMFHCNVVKHGQNGELRQKGKQAELACGYGGSVGAMKAMGALDLGMQEDELKPLVDAWRDANPNIVKYWWHIDEAVKTCIKEHKKTRVGSVAFRFESGMLFIDLPSGRSLAYVKPRIGENQFGGESITYMGVGMTKKWERLESYGPKFVENIVQASARDLLMNAMKELDGYRIVAHVHDEVVIEVEQDADIKEIRHLMSKVPDWGEGLVLNADGYECEFYMKD